VYLSSVERVSKIVVVMKLGWVAEVELLEALMWREGIATRKRSYRE